MILQIQPNIFEQILTILESWDKLFSGFIVTMWLYMWALLIGFFLVLLLALLRQYGGMIFSTISSPPSISLSKIARALIMRLSAKLLIILNCT